MKKVMLLFLGVIFFSSCHIAHAALFINEVMYDLSGADSTGGKSREWIEIFNSSSSDVSIDASLWRIYDGGANRTINGEVNFSIPANAYVIFAGDKDTFLTDHSGFSGTVYDTGITTLNNTAATIKLLDQDGNIVDSLSFASSLGGAGDGNSLQKISGAWTGASPTPALANEVTPPPSSSSADSDPDSSNNNSQSGSTSGGGSGQNIYLNQAQKEQKIKTKILTKNLALATVPLEFSANTTGHYGEVLPYGKYFWNFGDGDFKELNVNEEKFSHTYFYAGEYTVTLEYYMNYASETPEAVDKITIRVIDPDILISNVGDEKDFFVEITNNTNYDADISKWILSSEKNNFSLPKNTILGAKKKMTISPNITHLSFEDKNSLKLMTPQRAVVFDYSAPVVSTKKGKIIQFSPTIIPNKENQDNTPDISPESLGASPVLSDINTNNFNFSLPVILFVVFVGIASSFVYFIRQKKTPISPGDDFELLDE